MRTSEEAEAALRATLARVGLAETALGTALTATLARPHEPAASNPPGAALPPVGLGGAGADLVPTRELGRGGMGVVHAAEQRSIGREVAIKTVRGAEPSVVRALLREARIMGALEHPSLVPVHALGVGADGAPVLVMKRIDGVSWRVLLDEPEHPAWAPLLAGHGDRLRANLEVLAQVCRALAFAHERGVVHRDLKPENVMIGRFGEVVLLDWGVALRLSERDAEPEGVVGTPGYLAPEMARADPRLVDARTDVYLLGATLYELLTGLVLHAAPTVLGALAAALVGELPAMNGVPHPELVDLVRRACALEPGQRPQTAEALREELAHFLATRDADALVADARAALERAETAARTEGAASPAVARAIVEARFGLTSALKMRPADSTIRAELDRAITRAVERELALRSPDAARAIAAELSTPPAELVSRIESLAAEVAAERAAAAALARAREEADASLGSTPLRVVSVLALILALPIGIRTAWRAYTDESGFEDLAVADSVILGIVAIGSWVARARVLATEGTRRAWAVAVTWCVTSAVSDAVTYMSGGTIRQASVHSLVASGAALALASVVLGRRMILLALVNACAVVVGLGWPRAATAAITFSLLVNLVIWVWAVGTYAERSRGRA